MFRFCTCILQKKKVFLKSIRLPLYRVLNLCLILSLITCALFVLVFNCFEQPKPSIMLFLDFLKLFLALHRFIITKASDKVELHSLSMLGDRPIFVSAL